MSTLRTIMFVMLGMVLLAGRAAAQVSGLEAISSSLVAHDSLRGRFTQTKTLSFLTTPIVSTGRFSLSAASGLDWLVETPLHSRMQVNGAAVTLDGVAVRDRGVGEFMATIMRAFMTGDLQEVGERFEIVSAVDADGGWRMTLTPKSVLMRSVVSRIELQGAKFLEQLAIVEVDDTSTLVDFYEVMGEDLQSQAEYAHGA